MQVKDLVPGHVRRAENFTRDVNTVLAQESRLLTGNVFDVAADSDSMLQSQLQTFPMSELERQELIDLHDAIDQETIYTTEIEVYATAKFEDILESIVLKIDDLAATYGGILEDDEDRIAKIRKKRRPSWELCARYIFAD